MVEIFLLQILIDLDVLIPAVQSVLKVSHSFDFSLAVDELVGGRFTLRAPIPRRGDAISMPRRLQEAGT